MTTGKFAQAAKILKHIDEEHEVKTLTTKSAKITKAVGADDMRPSVLTSVKTRVVISTAREKSFSLFCVPKPE